MGEGRVGPGEAVEQVDRTAVQEARRPVRRRRAAAPHVDGEGSNADHLVVTGVARRVSRPGRTASTSRPRGSAGTLTDDAAGV